MQASKIVTSLAASFQARCSKFGRTVVVAHPVPKIKGGNQWRKMYFSGFRGDQGRHEARGVGGGEATLPEA